MRSAMLVGFACGASAYNVPAAGITVRPAVRAASAPLFMMAEDSSVAEQSLEAEFASVKAASEVAVKIMPEVEAMSKQSTKPNPVIGAWRRTKSLVGLRKDVKEAASLISKKGSAGSYSTCYALRSGSQLVTIPAVGAGEMGNGAKWSSGGRTDLIVCAKDTGHRSKGKMLIALEDVDCCFGDGPNEPGRQGVGSAEPTGQAVPAGHSMHWSRLER